NWWAWGGLSVFAPILLLGFYWKRATREGAIVSMVVGFVTVCAWYKAGLNTLLHYTFVAFAVTAVVLVIVSLCTKEPPARIQEMVAELNQRESQS
ncbi:MAG: sodium:proline symporter, partial [Lachnospiraceae bacterium]|nr:sodium:proline symporter [Lachnospiraceae bacterium]